MSKSKSIAEQVREYQPQVIRCQEHANACKKSTDEWGVQRRINDYFAMLKPFSYKKVILKKGTYRDVYLRTSIKNEWSFVHDYYSFFRNHKDMEGLVEGKTRGPIRPTFEKMIKLSKSLKFRSSFLMQSMSVNRHIVHPTPSWYGSSDEINDMDLASISINPNNAHTVVLTDNSGNKKNFKLGSLQLSIIMDQIGDEVEELYFDSRQFIKEGSETNDKTVKEIDRIMAPWKISRTLKR